LPQSAASCGHDGIPSVEKKSFERYLSTMPEGVVQLTDPRVLRAVAHPTRLKLMASLRRFGPLTATQAGERIGESPAGCSFHLRSLAKYGLVEEAGGGRGRERPWRATAHGHEWAARGPSEEVDEAGDLLTRVVVQRWFEEATEWIDRRHEESAEWSEAALSGDDMIAVTAAELADINRRVKEILAPYAERVRDRDTQPPDARDVFFLQLAFPFAEDPPPP
jgi:predicted ArsR family transcriptional regulator